MARSTSLADKIALYRYIVQNAIEYVQPGSGMFYHDVAAGKIYFAPSAADFDPSKVCTALSYEVLVNFVTFCYHPYYLHRRFHRDLQRMLTTECWCGRQHQYCDSWRQLTGHHSARHHRPTYPSFPGWLLQVPLPLCLHDVC
jgi:hypothetical protein